MESSALSKVSQVEGFLKGRGFGFATTIRASHVPPAHVVILIPTEHISSRVDKSHTSQRQLKFLQSAIRKEFGIEIAWIITHAPLIGTLEAALLEVLNRNFPDVFAEVFVSNPQISPLWIWVETRPGLMTFPPAEALENICFQLLKPFGLQKATVLYSHTQELPSNPIILRLLKVYSPVNVEQLGPILLSKGMTIPNDRWLNTKVDTLRRQGLIVRLGSGAYVLSEAALSAVPHGKGRTSSDIERVLALGKRKW